MNWMGVRLLTREQWAAALRSIASPGDGRAFMEIYRLEQPEHADQVVGYLTAELPPPLDDRARRFLGVRHPLHGDDGHRPTPEELFDIGVRHGVEGLPAWLEVAWSIPREDERLCFTREEVDDARREAADERGSS
jgi:hypothetical protein